MTCAQGRSIVIFCRTPDDAAQTTGALARAELLQAFACGSEVGSSSAFLKSAMVPFLSPSRILASARLFQE